LAPAGASATAAAIYCLDQDPRSLEAVLDDGARFEVQRPMLLVVNRIADVEARAMADYQYERHLERLVRDTNQLDKVELHPHGPRCGAWFASWFGEVFCCVEPCGHGCFHRTAATPAGDVWTWTSDPHSRADGLTNLDAENFDAWTQPRSRLALGTIARLG